MSECKCDMRTKLVGDGCCVCNPQLARDIAIDNLMDTAEDACRFLESYCRGLELLYQKPLAMHEDSPKSVTVNLRAALDKVK